MNRLLTSFSAMAMLGAAATAQVATGYLFSQTTGVYVPITGGTLVAAASGTSGAPALDDVTYPTVALPFAFTFDNSSYTAVNINSNGFLTFGATAPAGATYGALSGTTAYAGAVAAFSRDIQAGFCFAADVTIATNTLTNVSLVGGPMQVGDFLSGTGIPVGTTIVGIAGNVVTMSANATASGVAAQCQAFGTGSEIRYETLGSSPNQVFVVQWKGFKRFSTGTISQHMTLNFQVRLSQTSNVIDVVYGDCSPGVSTTTTVIQVGLRGPNTTFPANINNRRNVKGTSDWATSLAGTANSSGEVFNNVAPANVIPNGLTYNWTPQLIASNVNYGTGCGAVARASFYEYTIPSTAFDLSNTAISMVNTGTGYLVMPGTTTFVAPTGGATNLLLGDDAIGTVTPSAAFPYPGGSAASLVVCSNGFVSVASNGTSYQPLPSAFLNWANTAWSVWRDFVTTTGLGGGDIWREEVGGVLYVTWLNVLGYHGTVVGVTPSTFQFQFDLATGNVHIVFLSMDTVSLSTWTGGDGYIVGYSPGGASLDPGSIDISAVLPGNITLQPDVLPLALAAAPTPLLGNIVVYTTSNIPAGAVISAHLISLGTVNPGTPIPGAPGCLQLVDLSLSATNLLFGSPSATFSLTVPNDAGLIGLPLANQSASLVPGFNPLEVITSNGIRSTISNF